MNRLLLTAPLAILVSSTFLFAAAGPAAAKPADCTLPAAELRTTAASVETDVARQALRHVDIGEKLCDAGNDRAAVKKFAAAARVLGIAGNGQFAAKTH
jgi:hypothetical protein